MEINAHFSERVVVHSDELDWIDSPVQGVERKMSDRIGDEVARATSVIRYAPGRAFSPHIHTSGEVSINVKGGAEIFVLNDCFA